MRAEGWDPGGTRNFSERDGRIAANQSSGPVGAGAEGAGAFAIKAEAGAREAGVDTAERTDAARGAPEGGAGEKGRRRKAAPGNHKNQYPRCGLRGPRVAV